MQVVISQNLYKWMRTHVQNNLHMHTVAVSSVWRWTGIEGGGGGGWDAAAKQEGLW